MASAAKSSKSLTGMSIRSSNRDVYKRQPQDAALTDREPLWQTSWASEYLANEDYEKYAARVGAVSYTHLQGKAYSAKSGDAVRGVPAEL